MEASRLGLGLEMRFLQLLIGGAPIVLALLISRLSPSALSMLILPPFLANCCCSGKMGILSPTWLKDLRRLGKAALSKEERRLAILPCSLMILSMGRLSWTRDTFGAVNLWQPLKLSMRSGADERATTASAASVSCVQPSVGEIWLKSSGKGMRD